MRSLTRGRSTEVGGADVAWIRAMSTSMLRWRHQEVAAPFDEGHTERHIDLGICDAEARVPRTPLMS